MAEYITSPEQDQIIEDVYQQVLAAGETTAGTSQEYFQGILDNAVASYAKHLVTERTKAVIEKCVADPDNVLVAVEMAAGIDKSSPKK